jgi:UDP-2,3-diacylglucosamine hydrolase
MSGRSGTPPPLPAFFEMAAPEGWTAIDFISDLHLSEATPRTRAAVARHLVASPAELVVILGDLFELWVGDDQMAQPFAAGLVETLAEAASRRELAFMVGNRDFLAGPRLRQATGWRALPDPTVLDAWGQRVLLSHGDALCLDDEPYQAFRAEVRSDAWQRGFLAQSLDERLRIAADIRRASRASREGHARRAFDGDMDVDVDTSEAVRWMHSMGAHELVHGHTHRPGSHPLAPGFKRHVLSDWDLDHAERAEVLRLTRDGFVRLPPAP